MATRPDKQKVVDEIWDDDRIREFLDRQPADPDLNADHHTLLNAYQNMRAADFRRFLAMFTAGGGELDARDRRGRTLAENIARHRHSGEFIEALVAHGATAPTSEHPTAEA